MSYRTQIEDPANQFRHLGPSITTRDSISAHVAQARLKHPRFVRNRLHLVGVLFEEIGEFLWALFVERKAERIRAEALDIVAVLIRLIEGDKWTRH